MRPAAIWHSGKLRARQTAEPFWKACNPLADFEAVQGLQPTDPPERMRDRLAGETRNLMIVGHFPNLPRLWGLLITGDPDATADFQAHGLVALESTERGWEERWRLGEPRD